MMSNLYPILTVNPDGAMNVMYRGNVHHFSETLPTYGEGCP